jgi:hypothetical protein
MHQHRTGVVFPQSVVHIPCHKLRHLCRGARSGKLLELVSKRDNDVKSLVVLDSLLAKEARDLLPEHSTIPNGSPGRKDEKKCINA